MSATKEAASSSSKNQDDDSARVNRVSNTGHPRLMDHFNDVHVVTGTDKVGNQGHQKQPNYNITLDKNRPQGSTRREGNKSVGRSLSEIQSQDHDYSERVPVVNDKNVTKERGEIIDKSTGISRVNNIDELKKVTPKVKLLSPELTTNLSQLSAMKGSNLGKESMAGDDIEVIKSVEQSRYGVKDYCRTCAGLKLPLVDIFSEKGIQMRLNQQMKHLEEINKEDSLSTRMCMDCICDLKMSYKFFMQIKKAQVKLQSIHSALEATAVRRKISAPIITQVAKKSESEKITEANKRVQAKVQSRGKEDVTLQLSDNESIEEFDPEDPPFESDNVEPDIPPTPVDEKKNTRSPKLPEKESSNGNNKTVYQYDPRLQAYVKVEPPRPPPPPSSPPPLIMTKPPPPANNDNNGSMSGSPKTKDLSPLSKQPNILKRKVPPLREDLAKVTRHSSEFVMKKPKLNVENPVNIKKEKEDGIIYVTVKGTKPNEMLLVKVKKMDKSSGEKKKEEKKKEKGKLVTRNSSSIGPNEAQEDTPATSNTREADYLEQRAKALDSREQLIADQIEEYKKKREQILGGTTGLPNALKFEDGMIRFVNPVDNGNENPPENVPVEANEEPPKVVEEIRRDVVANERKEREVKRFRPIARKKGLRKFEWSKLGIYSNNTGEYLSRLAKLKRKWEEAKRKKELLQRELAESSTKGNLEKLARILGEKEKNLGEFQDYLKQRKIVITRLRDEDIISLYEDRKSTSKDGGGSSAEQPTIDEKKNPEAIPAAGENLEGEEDNYLDCDYCLARFKVKDLLEEHEKTHDYKLMYYCEDCQEEFPSIKSKRAHNGNCIKKLICKYCDLMLDSKGKKRQHEQKHVDNIYGQLCDVCGEKFKHQGTLDQHMKTQHMTWEKIHECPKCPKKFAFKQKLSFHLKSVHTSLRAYLCEDCGADFKNPASLRHHRIRKHHPTGNKRECPVCNKLVPFYSLSKHMYTHKAYTIQCPHCDKMFKNSSTLKQHLRIHEDQRQYRCDTCGVGFNRRDGLRLHMRVHQKSDSRSLKECSCQICSEKFPNHSMLVIHRNRVHKDGRQYTCHICNRSMLSPRSLEWHMSHIHNETTLDEGAAATGSSSGSNSSRRNNNNNNCTITEKKRVSCVHCEKTFKTEMILRTHIKNTHMKKDPTKCLDCELTFTSDVRLRHHMMIAHNRIEGTLPCPHCNKRFVNQLRLKTHMISHSEDRPYTCEICGFNLKTKIQLIKHHQNRHSDERPLQCRFCPWRCKQVSALVCHERTHTNERPYSCVVCRQRFKYLGDKNKHERRHEALGGSGFKRIVGGRNFKTTNNANDTTIDHPDTSNSDQEQLDDEQGTDTKDIVHFDESDEVPQEYQQEYEETSRETSEAAEVIMSMEDTTVYTEEVTADNIETAEIITDEIITNEILHSGTVVHLQQQDDNGKIQVIPVMLSLPDLSDSRAEVNLATASIMYNN